MPEFIKNNPDFNELENLKKIIDIKGLLNLEKDILEQIINHKDEFKDILIFVEEILNDWEGHCERAKKLSQLTEKEILEIIDNDNAKN